MRKILLIEDEVNLATITAETLSFYGYIVYHAKDAKSGKDIYYLEKPDLLIVDIMMPGKSGYEFVREIRLEDRNIPIIFLTAKDQLYDLLKGFDVGANDYVKKPFKYEELIARIGALLRFPAQTDPKNVEKKFVIGQYAFDAESQELISNLKTYQLSFKEAEILRRLCENMNNVVDRKALLREFWGEDNFFHNSTLNVFINKLRKYLADDAKIQILTLRTVGFKLLVKK